MPQLKSRTFHHLWWLAGHGCYDVSPHADRLLAHERWILKELDRRGRGSSRVFVCEDCGTLGAVRSRRLNPRNLHPQFRVLCGACRNAAGFVRRH